MTTVRAAKTAAKTPPTKAAFAELNALIVAALDAQFALGLRIGRDVDQAAIKATRRENHDAMRAMFAALHAMTVRAAK